MSLPIRTTFYAVIARLALLAGAALVLQIFATPAWSAGPKNLTEAMLRKGMHMQPGAKLSFEDVNGKPINFAEFKRLMADHSFGKTEDMTSGDTVLRISPSTTRSVDTPLAVSAEQPFPAFRLHMIDGRVVDNAALHGHPALISFFFDTCIPCIEEVPALNAFAKSHPDYRTLAVTFDSKDEAATFRRQRHLAWPIAYGANKLIATLSVKSYPTLVLLDAQGRVVRSGTPPNSGRTRKADIERWVRNAGKP